jgi:hypothetical protein
MTVVLDPAFLVMIGIIVGTIGFVVAARLGIRARSWPLQRSAGVAAGGRSRRRTVS